MNAFPRPAIDGHKYHRGHAVILGAPELTGATRLAAQACSRIGAGLVTVVAEESAEIYKVTLPPDIMVRPSIPEIVEVVLGGSGGVPQEAFTSLLESTELKARVFDADALQANTEFRYLDDHCILTPHIGEFERMFGQINTEHDIAAARGAELSGAVIVLKSPKTIVAHPNGQLVINTHTSPYLAKAGTGDVLAGLITGLVSQGMPNFLASCAAVWIHGEAGIRLGVGLIASDLPEVIPQILHDLIEQNLSDAH